VDTYGHFGFCAKFLSDGNTMVTMLILWLFIRVANHK